MKKRATTLPGDILVEEFLQPLGISQNQLALHTSLPMSRINRIIHGQRTLTAETALRFARFFGNSPEFWLNLQMLHDLTKAKLALGKAIETEVRPYNSAAEISHSPNGLPCFPPTGDVVTHEMIRKIQDELDEEDVRKVIATGGADRPKY